MSRYPKEFPIKIKDAIRLILFDLHPNEHLRREKALALIIEAVTKNHVLRPRFTNNKGLRIPNYRERITAMGETMTAYEIAEVLGRTPSAIHRYCNKYNIPYVKIENAARVCKQ